MSAQYFLTPFLISVSLLSVSAAHAQILVQGPSVAITAADIEAELSASPDASVRSQGTATARRVQNLATTLYLRRALANQALEAALDQDPAVKRRLEMAREIVLSEARVRQIEQTGKPTATAVQAYARTLYAANPERYRVKDSVRVRHILIPRTDPEAKDKADQLLARLRAGASFAELAREASADQASAANGGDLGFVERGRTVAPFEEAAFALASPGQMSEVIATQFGYHIIKLEEKRPAGVRPFEEVRDSLVADAELRMANQAREELNEKLLAGAKYDEDAIRNFSRAQKN